MPRVPPPAAVCMVASQYSAPNVDTPAGQFLTEVSVPSFQPQFGSVNYGDGAGAVPAHIAFLFALTALQGATINEAMLTITNAVAGASPQGVAYVEAVDNAVPLSSGADGMNRVLDTASSDQVTFTLNGTLNAVTTINLTSAIQTLVNREGWAPGRMQIHLRCNNGQSGFCSPLPQPTLQIVASTADPTLTFAQQMVQKLEAALLANPTAQAINIDGTTVTFADLQKRLQFFYAQMAKESGERSTFTGVDLGRFRP